jgi:hypothetical protein
VRRYGVALLTGPLLMEAVYLVLSLFLPRSLLVLFGSDDRSSLLLFGVAVGLLAGITEELGKETSYVSPD